MSETTTDHDEIREWAEKHGGRPATVKSTHKGEDVGVIRLMFPKAPNHNDDALEAIEWDEFFEKFDESNLALLYEPKSNFNKLIGRETAEKRAHGDHKAHR